MTIAPIHQLIPSPVTPTMGVGDRPAIRSARHDAAALPAALRSEWIKVSTLRSNQALVALTGATGLATSWGAITFAPHDTLSVSTVFIYSTRLTSVLAAIAGILLFSAETQHGTIGVTLTSQPSRLVTAASKAVTAAGYGLVLGATSITAGIVGAVLGRLPGGDSGGMVAMTAWALLFTSLAAVLGLGVGMIVRHGPAAISGPLVWMLVIENLLSALAPARLTRFLPFMTGKALVPIAGLLDAGDGTAVALSRTEDALAFAAYSFATLAIGTVLLSRRDAN